MPDSGPHVKVTLNDPMAICASINRVGAQFPRNFVQIFFLVLLSNAILFIVVLQYGKYTACSNKLRLSNESMLLWNKEEQVKKWKKKMLEYVVETNGCRIKKMDAFDSHVMKYVTKMPPIDCTTSPHHPPLTYTVNGIIYIDHHAAAKLLKNASLVCCQRTLTRQNDSDTSTMIASTCQNIVSGSSVQGPFIQVECRTGNGSKYLNYHATIPTPPPPSVTPSNRKKVKHMYNILVVGLDSVARLSAHRQIPKTIRYIKDRMNAIEMYGYTKVGDNTFPNLIPVLSGLSSKEIDPLFWNPDAFFDKVPLIWKSYKKSGYKTLYAEDESYMSTFNYLMKGFQQQPTDYYFRPFISTAELKVSHRENVNVHECLGHESKLKVVLDWITEFQTKVSTVYPTFAFSWINSFSHDDENRLSQVDDQILNFFQNLYEYRYLDKTVVFFMSDHGMRWGPVREKLEQGYYENRLPMMFIYLPGSFRRANPSLVRAVHFNARRLTSNYDIFATLNNLLEFEGIAREVNTAGLPSNLGKNVSSRSRTLFREIADNRTCNDAQIAEEWCACHDRLVVSTRDQQVDAAAMQLLTEINQRLKPHFNNCATLRISAIKHATVVFSSEYNARDYQVRVATTPGTGLFEATYRIFPDPYPPQLIGKIARLTLYNDEPNCIKQPGISKDVLQFCYCYKS